MDRSTSGPSTLDAAVTSEDERVAHDHGKMDIDPFLGPSTSSSNIVPSKPRPKYKPALAAIENHKREYDSDESDDERPCGLCQTSHGPGSCFMTQNPTNLVEYRSMLIAESNEPVEMRRAAVQAIDTHLASRGLSNLIKGQPQPFAGQGDTEPLRKKRKRKSKRSETLQRPASPGGSSPAKKKAKRVGDIASPCLICGGPVHLAKACPVVKNGPERFVRWYIITPFFRGLMTLCSIRQAISRLAQDPAKVNTVHVLRSLLPNTESVGAPSSASATGRTEA
jgi:hypothetical protein